MKTRAVKILALLTLAAALCVGLSGCGKPDDGTTPAQVEQGNKLSQIAQKSGGDWSKLSPEEQEFMKQMAYGSEPNAKMLLSQAARNAPSSPGPGKGGAPSGG